MRRQSEPTPRRDASLSAPKACSQRQPDTEERVWGPANPRPADAVAGFAKKQGLDPNQLEILSDGKAENTLHPQNIPADAGRSRSWPNTPATDPQNSIPEDACTGPDKVRFVSSAPSAGS